ncbi:Antibiotic biosynthesis monooxygenase [Geosmithia morbida]|uniref:Antibiotic biosynthesis monooxygenase n=1 Tax=Geosmithia morbida TaxID=1094350 RepID=A0A9P5D497_9HYPO|nr:Antibiotic biosynthesis monooxygenase [Geosmithia morbida]KAF4121279.1 Antibiotic biosynthesis monooxygenase [Geosmithia morbida]
MALIDLTAIITPKSPEKGLRFLALFEACVSYTEKYERGYVYRYELHKGIPDKNGKEQFVVLESYKDEDGMQKHMKSPPVLELVERGAKEDLTDVQVILTTKGAGISSKL